MSHLAIYLLALAVLSPARPALALGGGLQDLASFPKYQVDFLNDLPLSESEAAALRHAGLTHEDQFLHLHPSRRSRDSDTTVRDTIGGGDVEDTKTEAGGGENENENRPAPRGPGDSSLDAKVEAQRIALVPMLYTPATSPDIVPHSYLCAMPSGNTTASQTAAVEEAVDEPEADPEESWRALDHLNGQCLYLRMPQSWFTYSYCHNKAVRQFRERQVPHPHPEGFVPQEDDDYEAYTLGAAHPRKRRGMRNELQRTGTGGGSDEPEQTAAFGQSHASRYLVQRWGDGTRCDLTGKPREIEVQVYCSMTGTDAIYMVNEVAICQYVIVIHTPNLCSLPGFRPTTALEVDPAPIRCREVVSDDEFDEWVTGADERQRLRLEQAQRLEQGGVDARLASKEQDPDLKIDGLKGVELTQEDISALLAAAFGGVSKAEDLSHGEGEGEESTQEKPSQQGLEELYVVGYSEDADGNRVPVEVESVPPTKGESRRAFLERLQALIEKELQGEDKKRGDKAAPTGEPKDTVPIQRDEL